VGLVGSVLKYEWNRAGTAFTCEYDISGSPRIAICELLNPGAHVYLATDDFLTPDCGTQIKTNTEYSPSFTPDGSGVVFASNFVIGRAPVTGSAAQTPVAIDLGGGLRCDEFAAWAPDGKHLAIEAGNPLNSQLWMRGIASTTTPQCGHSTRRGAYANHTGMFHSGRTRTGAPTGGRSLALLHATGTDRTAPAACAKVNEERQRAARRDDELDRVEHESGLSCDTIEDSLELHRVGRGVENRDLARCVCPPPASGARRGECGRDAHDDLVQAP